MSLLDKAIVHLVLDDITEDEKNYVSYLIDVASATVARHLDIQNLDELANEQGLLPPDIEHVILLLVGNLYNNREPNSDKTNIEIPYTLRFLLEPFRKY